MAAVSSQQSQQAFTQQYGQQQQSQQYRIRPTYQTAFSETQVKTAMEKFVKDTLSGVTFDTENVTKWSKEISHNIKTFLKSCNWPRYKFMVQVVIGENSGQGVNISTRQFWDKQNDRVVSYQYQNDSLYCCAIAYGIYHY